MNHRRIRDVAILVAATALTRFAFRSHYLYDVNSVNFALALGRFDPSAHQPHPPGYFLYVCLGRLVNLLFHDANAALVAIGILFSCGTVATICALADNWFDSDAALFAGLIFLFSPLAWFHGTVALTYAVETFFSALAGYLCWRISEGALRFILLCAAVVGVAAGFRPSSLLLLAPLFLFSLRKAGFGRIAGGIGTLTLTLLAWCIPMIRIGGGKAYISSLVSLWLAVPARATVFNSSPLNSLVRALVIAGIYFLCFGCAAFLPLRASRAHPRADPSKAFFTGVWIAPGLLLFTFIYLKFVNSGYLLALSPPVCAWMGFWASRWYADLRMPKAGRIVAVAGLAAVNTAIFIGAPVYCSWASVRQFEAQLENEIRILPLIASSRDTMIVGFDSHFSGYRHAGYYLPDYLTVQFPAVRLTAGKRIFAMQNRLTWLDSGLDNTLDNTHIRNFIIFPLPPDDPEYSHYTAMVRRRFPAGELHTIVRGGREFDIGPVADLRFLFPDLFTGDDCGRDYSRQPLTPPPCRHPSPRD